MKNKTEYITKQEYKPIWGLVVGSVVVFSTLLLAWSEHTWPFIFFIIYLAIAIGIGVQNRFALMIALICLQPLIPYYPIASLGGAALQDLFFLSALLLLLFSIPIKKEGLRVTKPIVLPYLCLAGWAAFGAVATQSNLSEFLVALAKGSGRPLIIALTCLVVGAVIRDFRRSEILFKAILITATFEAVLGIMAMIFNIEIVAGGLHLGVQNLPYQMAPGVAISRRLHGTFPTGNLTGAYFVVTLPLTIVFALLSKKPRERMFWLLCALLQFIALILTFTRASLVSCVLALLVLGVMYRGRRRWRVVFQVVLLLAIGYFILTTLSPEILSVVAGRFLYAHPENRLAPAWAGLRMIGDYPLWGVGVDNSVPMMESNPRYSITPFGETTVRPHNSFIFIAAELGLPAGLILFWIVVSITKFISRAMRSSKEANTRLLSAAVMSGWLGELFHSLTNNLFHHPSLMVTHIAVIAALNPLIHDKGVFSINPEEGRETK